MYHTTFGGVRAPIRTVRSTNLLPIRFLDVFQILPIVEFHENPMKKISKNLGFQIDLTPKPEKIFQNGQK